MKQIPVIDIFAGPGGLGEGFASFTATNGVSPFQIHLSIEKDPVAHQTLLLRAFYRQFDKGAVPLDYYDHLRGNIDRETLFRRHPQQAKDAKKEAWHQELRRAFHNRVKRRIKASLRTEETWVLIGGPPCQAYSLAGRSRIRKIKKRSRKRDQRHYLYREYLRIIADHNPPVFVMENVKGLLSSTTGKRGKRIFEKIYRDLQDPKKAIYGNRNSKPRRLTYRIFPLTSPQNDTSGFEPSDYVIRSEEFAVPQCRHRVILLGLRSDLDIVPRRLVARPEIVPVKDIISDLPKLRSALSKSLDGRNEWINTLRRLENRKWLVGIRDKTDLLVKKKVLSVLGNIDRQKLSTGAEYVKSNIQIRRHRLWYYDYRLGGACNHAARSHISKDLHRYLFAACFAKVFRRSPTLKDFPRPLLPKHRNVTRARKGSLFSDRFRVQVEDKPASTITSHISKDGHYFIHPDPYQCRSLTVREAARLQTFPDNYFFAGPRTFQYQQVGNAVPPYLAKQIARIVFDALSRTNRL